MQSAKKTKHIIPGKFTSVAVIDGHLNDAIRSWKKMNKDHSTIEKCYDKKSYVKPSTWRREQKQRAVYNQILKDRHA